LIVEALTLALSTVKWYVNTLYAKLQVKTRAQAIARAHALRLHDS
jgi:ATP/maltotriose-dependent transcriptional regulator MalT